MLLSMPLADRGSGDHHVQICSLEVSTEEECFYGKHSFHGNSPVGHQGSKPDPGTGDGFWLCFLCGVSFLVHHRPNNRLQILPGL